MYSKKRGDQQFTKDGRGAETTIDLVLQAREKVSDNRVNGPEDAVVSEMIKQLPQEKIYIITRCYRPGQRCLQARLTDLGMQLYAK